MVAALEAMSAMLAAGGADRPRSALPGVFAGRVERGLLDGLQLVAVRVGLDKHDAEDALPGTSNPSRRMVSMSTERWSTPRPATAHAASCLRVSCDAHGDVGFLFAHKSNT